MITLNQTKNAYYLESSIGQPDLRGIVTEEAEKIKNRLRKEQKRSRWTHSRYRK